MKRSRVIVGLVLVILVVGGLTGAALAFDDLSRLATQHRTEVTVERINETHAAVAWTTEFPTYGYLNTSIQARCGGAWLQIKSINDSSHSRRHRVVAPIYDLNRSRIQPTVASGVDGPWKQQPWHSPVQYKVTVNTYEDRDPSETPKTFFTGTISQSCQ